MKTSTFTTGLTICRSADSGFSNRLRFTATTSGERLSIVENDLNLFRDMRESVMEVLDACETETVINRDEFPGGFASHEVGTCRMGTDPKTSVLNSYCQSHEIKNLFVVDGSCFTTFSEKNPTLTIAALAIRSARHIAALRMRGEL